MRRRFPVLRRLLARRLSAASLIVLAVILLAAVLAPWVAPYDPQRMDILHRLQPPSFAHPFGTDDFGRDVLSRVIYGARLSITAGALVVTVATLAGTVLGLIAGYV